MKTYMCGPYAVCVTMQVNFANNLFGIEDDVIEKRMCENIGDIAQSCRWVVDNDGVATMTIFDGTKIIAHYSYFSDEIISKYYNGFDFVKMRDILSQKMG